MTRPKRLPLVLVGAGGHAKVLADLIEAGGRWRVYGAVDAAPRGAAALGSGLRIVGEDAVLPDLLRRGVRHAAVGVGASPDTAARARLRRRLLDLGFRLPALVHPRAFISPGALVEDGAQVMALAGVNPGARVGPGAVVNTGAVVEHDCALGDDCFIGPAAALGGDVAVGERAFIGLGAVVNPGLTVGARAIVGAGAVVVSDVREARTVYGVPAREAKRR